MNTANNKRRRESIHLIESAFIDLLQTTPLTRITVSDLCKATGLNRSTFYSNFLDIYDLADKLRVKLEEDFSELFADYDTVHQTDGALKMFTHIKENQIFYTTYFKLCREEEHLVRIYDEKQAEQYQLSSNLKYHIEFFRNGLNAIIRLWLKSGCQESPEEMAQILKEEYRGR